MIAAPERVTDPLTQVYVKVVRKALHRLPLNQQRIIQDHYQLPTFKAHPNARAYRKHAGSTLSAQSELRYRAYKQLRNDVALQQVVLS